MSSGKNGKHQAAAAAAPAPVSPPAPPKPNFQGKYKFTRNEDFEDYLVATGFNWVTRKIILHASPDLIITQEEDKITIKQNCLTQNKELSFTVGEDFETIQGNGHVMKVSSHWDGDKLVLNLDPKEEGKGKAEKQTRELHDDELVLTHELGDIMARRLFKKTA